MGQVKSVQKEPNTTSSATSIYDPIIPKNGTKKMNTLPSQKAVDSNMHPANANTIHGGDCVQQDEEEDAEVSKDNPVAPRKASGELRVGKTSDPSAGSTLNRYSNNSIKALAAATSTPSKTDTEKAQGSGKEPASLNGTTKKDVYYEKEPIPVNDMDRASSDDYKYNDDARPALAAAAAAAQQQSTLIKDSSKKASKDDDDDDGAAAGSIAIDYTDKGLGSISFLYTSTSQAQKGSTRRPVRLTNDSTTVASPHDVNTHPASIAIDSRAQIEGSNSNQIALLNDQRDIDANEMSRLQESMDSLRSTSELANETITRTSAIDFCTCVSWCCACCCFKRR